MKTRTLLAILILFAAKIQAQVSWHSDYTAAQAQAMAEDKLLVIDFWANWCRPCKEMDQKLWSSPSIDSLKNNFVFLKVNVDVEQNFARRFNVSSIPHVAFATVNEDVIYEKVGFSHAEEYFKIMKQFPSKLEGLNVTMSPFINKSNTNADLFSAGVGFQSVAMQVADDQLNQRFFMISNDYYKKYVKTKDEHAKRAELLMLLNNTYLGKSKKVLTEIAEHGPEYYEADQAELRTFIMALCYKKLGDTEQMAKAKLSLKNDFFLTLLEK